MESRTDSDSISLGSEFRDRDSVFHSSLSFISVQSLSSARGSTPLTKKKTRSPSGRRYYDATQPMENDFEVPIYRLKHLRDLHKLGIIRIGNDVTDAKTRRSIDGYLKNSSRYSASTVRPRKDFPSLRAQSKTVTDIKCKQLEKYFINEHISRKENGGGKSVTFNLRNRRPFSESINLDTVLQDSSDQSKTSTSRSSSDRLLLRRPTIKQTQIKVDDDMCFNLAKSVNLKPFNFKSVNDQHLFYSQNFPLLLDTQSDENKPVVQARVSTPDEQYSLRMKREIGLNTRLIALESSLDTLDKETEDVDFKTVLRDEVFYPSKWSFNEKDSSSTVH